LFLLPGGLPRFRFSGAPPSIFAFAIQAGGRLDAFLL
jgi:hypothetical protein